MKKGNLVAVVVLVISYNYLRQAVSEAALERLQSVKNRTSFKEYCNKPIRLGLQLAYNFVRRSSSSS